MPTQSREMDVVVVGAGIAGLVSAVRALEYTDDVLVLEKGPRMGGSMYYSQGLIWTYDSMDTMREEVPAGDSLLQELVHDSLQDGLDWLETKGVTLKEPTIDLSAMQGQQVEPTEFIDVMSAEIREGGGEIELNTPMEELRTGTDGEVTGVVARSPDGDRIDVEAESVVLATGGFQGNEKLVEQHITTNTDDIWLRANPWSTGDGLLAAMAVGAKSTKGLSTFYGHNLAAPPAEFPPMEFSDATQYYGPYAVAVDAQGTRFTDESESELEETLTQDTARLASGRAYYLIDHDLYESTIHLGHVGTMVENARDYGARVAEASTLEELGAALADWGVDGNQAVETVRRFNEAVRTGAADGLHPPREDNREPLDSPPFYAVEVQPGITFTMGGIDVNHDAAVLRRAGSSSTLDQFVDDVRDVLLDPIEGLYAAGVDVGNVNNRHYMGGLSLGLVLGRIAGKNAAQAA